MVVGLPNGLFEFQEKAVKFLLDTTSRYSSKEVITIKSPTGERVIIVMGAVIFRALLRVTRYNCCEWCMRSKDFGSLIISNFLV